MLLASAIAAATQPILLVSQQHRPWSDRYLECPSALLKLCFRLARQHAGYGTVHDRTASLAQQTQQLDFASQSMVMRLAPSISLHYQSHQTNSIISCHSNYIKRACAWQQQIPHRTVHNTFFGRTCFGIAPVFCA